VHIRIRSFYPPTYSKVDSIQLATYDSSTIFGFLDFRFLCYSTLGWGGVELKLLIILVLSKGRVDTELKIDIR
jgi:hypothetical protein